ncbi:MAG: hypothetical protein M4579_003094 [Chaenotheca gracillima]|nr:MAG: hypothetical protein M4579_003094 [Chaenotheca gracillima]
MSSATGPDIVAPPPDDGHPSSSTAERKVENGNHETPPADIASSPPLDSTKSTSGAGAGMNSAFIEKDGGKSDSEAETIVLPGKESDASPSKRKQIKHEDGEGAAGDEKERLETTKISTPGPAGTRDESSTDAKVEAKPGRNGVAKDKAGREGGNSSDLSSAPSSPAARTHSSKRDRSESDLSRSSPPHVATEDGSAPTPRIPRKRKLEDREPHLEGSDHHQDNQRRRPTDTSAERTRERRETRSSTTRDLSPSIHSPPQRDSRDESHSPRLRAHRKSTSYSNITLSNGTSHKRKRPPPPLQPTNERSLRDGHSDESSRSASPAHRPRLTDHNSDFSSTMSPVKAPHRKTRIDQHGRTSLARLCAAEVPPPHELEARLLGHPEEINVADYAGNTPVQTASLEGKDKIVKRLIEAGCDVNCKNNDKDTPLIDAVENGHLGVVKLLLRAGADPRQGNVNGEEPLDLLDAENEHYNAIKAALEAAKNNTALRRASEDHNGPQSASVRDTGRTSRDVSVPSPRQSPPTQASRSPPPVGVPPRRKTVRSEATRNDLLWMKPTTENLRDRAGKGDMAGVANILNVLNQADTESLIGAARGGHDEVMQLLLGIGGADADPNPSSKHKPGWDTPMLAAIGRGNEKVIQLLLAQPKFNPTKRDHRGLTYYEIAKERQGAHWETEYATLKEAYDKHLQIRKGRRGTSSNMSESSRKVRDKDSEHTRRRPEGSLQSQAKRSPSPGKKDRVVGRRGSLTKESTGGLSDRATLPKDKGSQRSTTAQSTNSKAAKEFTPSTVDRESSHKSLNKESRAQSETGATANSEGDMSKPRRKLVSGKIYKGDQERQRRASVISTNSEENAKASHDLKKGKAKLKSQLTEGSSDDVRSRSPVALLKSSASDSEVHNSRASSRERTVKTEEAQDRISLVRREGSNKRPRNSASPPSLASQDTEFGKSEADRTSKKKRRRLELEDKRKSHLHATDNVSDGSKEERRKSPLGDVTSTKARRTLSGTGKAKDVKGHENPSTGVTKLEASEEHSFNRQDKDNNHRSKLDLPTERVEEHDQSRTNSKPKESDNSEMSPQQDPAVKTKEDREQKEQMMREQAEQLARKQAEEESNRRVEEERLKAEAEAEAERARLRQIEKDEADRKARIAREQEEAREEEKRKLEEAERQARVAQEEERARAEKKRREEEQQRRRAEQERVRREEAERRRAEHEERQRLELIQRQEEQERARREALPYSLQRLMELPLHQVCSQDEANDALPLYAVTLRQLDPECPDELADEKWVPNFQVAMVLGEKDLALSRYTAWSKRTITERQKVLLWRIVRMKLQGRAPMGLEVANVGRRDRLTQAKFRALDPVFWIKLSDFQDISPRYPHLRNVSLSTCPMEDLSREDKFLSPFAPRTNEDGWTVTPFQDGKFESYTPAINEQQNGVLDGSTVLFRPIEEPIFRFKRAPSQVNGFGNGSSH